MAKIKVTTCIEVGNKKKEIQTTLEVRPGLSAKDIGILAYEEAKKVAEKRVTIDTIEEANKNLETVEITYIWEEA